jgi:alpha-L-fucosidase 2
MSSISRPNRRKFLKGSAAATTLFTKRRLWPFSIDEKGATPNYKLHFSQPASKWPDALPVGNGRLGAMVFGQPTLERIQLNEESIWDGEPGRDRDNPKAGQAVPKIRELLFAGRIADAEAMAKSDMLSVPQRMPCYQTLGDLHLDFSPMGLGSDVHVDDYRLELDLDTGMVTTSFLSEGTKHVREIFSSAPNQVIVVRLTAAGPRKLSFNASLDRPNHFATETEGDNRLSLTGQAIPLNDNPGLPVKENPIGVRFYAELLALPDKDGITKASANKGSLEIREAMTVTLLLDCATSYRHPANTEGPSSLLVGDLDAMRAAVQTNLRVASNLDYSTLRERHTADHQHYFRRADLSFGTDPNAAIPTDQRVQHIKDGDEDIHLLPLYFQFGRYMLLSSSRPGTLAANLQGIWNEAIDPPWGSKYTININAEMNYWLAERANLAECHTPLFDLLDTTRDPGALTAKKYYNARGSVVHHNTDIWGDAGPIDGLGGGIWAMGGAWLSLHAWDHFAYGGDMEFLRQRVYPMLREHALFLLDYLVPAPMGTPYTGYLVTGPSCSPENKYKLPDGQSFNLCMGPTMDIAITRAVLTRLLEASALLPDTVVDRDIEKRAKTALDQLPPYRITHDGRLQEWPEDYMDQEPGHRHISHLFGLFPEDQISPDSTPELAKAARETLDKRLAAGGGSTGWSRSWIINCMARLQDGEAAYDNILQLFRQSTRHNLFDVCGLKENSPFQIDGNLGGPTGLIEMLLQSHAGVLRLLPALPKAWPNGNFKGFRARGGLVIDLEWKDGRATRATLRASLSRTHHIVLPKGQQVISVREGGRAFRLEDTGILQAHAGAEYVITFS